MPTVTSTRLRKVFFRSIMRLSPWLNCYIRQTVRIVKTRMSKRLKDQIFVENEMVVFGYGGFYERPKGWGLDVCYFHKSAFREWGGRRRIMKQLHSALEAEIRSGHLMEGFVPQFLQRLQKQLLPEWHVDRAELMFQSAKPRVPSLARYEDFPAFVRMVLAGRPFATPQELEQRVREYLQTLMPSDDPLEWVDNQTYLLFGYMQKAIERDMCELLGSRQGEWLFRQLLEHAPEDPRSAETLEEFTRLLFYNEKAARLIAQWHGSYFTRLLEQQKSIRKSLRKLKVTKRNGAAVAAQKAMVKATRDLPPELVTLLTELQVPLFVATGKDLFFFREFHQPGFLMHRASGELHQMVGLGLCVHRPEARGGIFVTYNAEEPERFWHTVMEEATHFADGPRDRLRLKGEARYSGTAEFRAAFDADFALHAPWQSSKVLGAREWGMILTQKRFPARRITKITQRIELYQAALDFLHYPEGARMAETFAALPIIEKAVGGRAARLVLPRMFAYYDRHYRLGLQEELQDYR